MLKKNKQIPGGLNRVEQNGKKSKIPEKPKTMLSGPDKNGTMGLCWEMRKVEANREERRTSETTCAELTRVDNFMPLFSHENSRGNIVSRAKRVRFERGLVKIAFSQSNLTFCNRKVSHDRFMFNVHFVEQMSHEHEVFFAFCFYWFIFTT